MPADKPTDHYFVDTNVWLYALIVNDDAQKHQIAAEIVQGVKRQLEINISDN